ASRAATLAQRVSNRVGGRSFQAFDVLAAAQAAAGQYDDAVRTGEQAVALARQAGQAALVQQLEARVALYRQRQPFIESRP
ncbi:MAG: hypothetical protein JXO22_15505, partial [Phycisphaerae bacterium]|nr:hypothetical protein [Phycisphaerae bacterium]